MGSRIHREVYVRFRGEAMETCHGDVKRRCSLSLQYSEGRDLAEREGIQFQNENGSDESSGISNGFKLWN